MSTGQNFGRDPFGPNADYLELDQATEEKLRALDSDFYKQDLDWDRFCRKTMGYVRKNRELFAPVAKTLK